MTGKRELRFLIEGKGENLANSLAYRPDGRVDCRPYNRRFTSCGVTIARAMPKGGDRGRAFLLYWVKFFSEGKMKALTLFLLRLSTGLLLVIWGVIKIKSPEAASAVSDKYYNGLISEAALHTPLGAAQVLLGVLVILGVFRNIVYPLQVVVLGVATAAIWQYLVDPLGLYLLDESSRKTLFFPSTTVFFATLALMAFKEYDDFSLGAIMGR